jgi:CHASE3 domain sensor protein
MTATPRLNETALFRRTLVRVITLPVFLLIMLALIFLWQLNSLMNAAQWVDHTDQVIAQAHTLQGLLIDQEIGLRGYMITGEQDFLDPYRQAQTSISPMLGALGVVVLTTSDDERDRIEAYNLNVAGYILKPVTFTAFVEAMATLNKYWTINEFP